MPSWLRAPVLASMATTALTTVSLAFSCLGTIGTPPSAGTGAVAHAVDRALAASGDGDDAPDATAATASQGATPPRVVTLADEVTKAPGAFTSEVKVTGVDPQGEKASGALATAVAPEAAAPETPVRADQKSDEDPASDDLAILTPVTESRDFTAAGLSWQRTPGVNVLEASVRIRQNGTWTKWSDLEIEGNEAAEGVDAGEAPAGSQDKTEGTQPMLTNGADAVQARVLTADGRAPKDVKVITVNGGGVPKAATAAEVDQDVNQDGADQEPVARLASTMAAAAATKASAPRSAGGAALMPGGIVSRKGWGADEKIAWTTSRRSAGLKAMYVHHTASTNNYTKAQAGAQLRSMYLYQVKTRDWDDMGYQFLVDKYGTIYQGRANAMQDLVVGAQASGFNLNTIGVSMVGNYEIAKPSAAMLSSLKKVLAWKGYQYGLNVRGNTVLTSAAPATGSTSRYKNGTRVSVPVILPHQKTSYTACPGKYMIAQLASVRSDVAKRIDAANRTYGPSGDALRTPVLAKALKANAGLVASGKLSMSWKPVAGAVGYQIMYRGGPVSGPITDTRYWFAGRTTTATSYNVTLDAGEAMVFGVRAYDKQGRYSQVLRMTQATRPSSKVKQAVATFTPDRIAFRAPGAGKPVLQSFKNVSTKNGAGSTKSTSVTLSWKAQADAKRFIVTVQRAPKGKKITDKLAWKSTAFSGRSATVKLAKGESVRIRVQAVSTFDKGSYRLYSVPVTRK